MSEKIFDAYEVGLRIAKLRKERGLTQQELAEEMAKAGFKVSRSKVKSWEDSSRPITYIGELYWLANFFNTSTDYICGRIEYKTVDGDLQKACEYTGLSDEAITNIHGLTHGIVKNMAFSLDDMLKSKWGLFDLISSLSGIRNCIAKCYESMADYEENSLLANFEKVNTNFSRLRLALFELGENVQQLADEIYQVRKHRNKIDTFIDEHCQDSCIVEEQ